MLSLTDVLRGTGGELAPGFEGDTTFARGVIDSRDLQPGDLFIALKGEHVDGHDFIPHAIASHAAGIIAARPPGAIPNKLAYVQVSDTLRALQDLGAYKLRQVDPLVIGITGTVGKTSTKEIVAGTLGQRKPVLKTVRNLNTEIGVPLSLLGIEPRHEIAVLEMGMYVPGDIRFLAELARPRIGIVTMVGHMHAERAGSIERIAEAKAELVDGLPRDGLAILNGDNSYTAAMANRGRRALLFGLEETNDVRATEVESRGLEGIAFRLEHRGASEPVELSLLGRHSTYHALAAAAVMLSLDYSLADTAAALRNFEGEPLRLHIVAGIDATTIIDDTYNSSPPAAEAALALLAEMPRARQRIAVLGDMRELGQYSAELHRQVGQAAARVADLLITVGEEARLIAEGAREAGLTKDRVIVTTTPDEATAQLRPRLGSGNYLLVKGSLATGLQAVVKAFLAGPA
ncbi:MAG TPA: UDP-N-acetylmuramoyl-tripeptide--D-alanyl-D-alanine ligase [Chloroflexota bacterium]|nr:UDP-N-acetylmuramoyl-tripeptide--D-alanyl-D-alanine ligase [Chloroflexota bacterium]